MAGWTIGNSLRTYVDARRGRSTVPRVSGRVPAGWLVSRLHGFIRGCEDGNDWQLLAGSREWFGAGSADNPAGEALVLHQTFPDGPRERWRIQTEPEFNWVAVETLLWMLDEVSAATGGASWFGCALR